MGLSELIAALENDAEVELQRRRAATEAEVARVHAAARAQASALLQRTVDGARVAADARAEREARDARARSARRLRQVREECLDAALTDVRAELSSIRTADGYSAAFERLLHEALRLLPHAEHVHVDPRDGALAREVLKHKGDTVEVVEDLRCAGGVVVAAPGRRIDNTVESRLAAAWPLLRSELASAWQFEQGSGGRDGSR